jgi:hypothetical protein
MKLLEKYSCIRSEQFTILVSAPSAVQSKCRADVPEKRIPFTLVCVARFKGQPAFGDAKWICHAGRFEK